MTTITKTDFHFPGQTHVYSGKVRDVYHIGTEWIIMIVTDRISAFDVVLPRPIPYKGQVLNQLAGYFLQSSRSSVPNWVMAIPDPNVTIGKHCTPVKVEMVIRGYLCGHAWRIYRSGCRTLCGVTLPQGLKENDPLPEPVLTPTTKASEGHDEDIARDEIIRRGIVSEADYSKMEQFTYTLFRLGSELARKRGLILADTKYEFGKDAYGNIVLIDEIHTPDSSRYFYADGYEQRQRSGEPQKQLSKEFLRQWLIENHFSGKPDQPIPAMTDHIVQTVSARYIELYERMTGLKFTPDPSPDPLQRIEQHVLKWLQENRK